MKFCLILGTRPEIIKFSPVIRELEKRKLDFFVIHTGQHYSYEMDKIFFEELNLPTVKYNLQVGSGNHGVQTGKMLEGIENILLKEKPDVVLVQGDTNSVLAGALAASKLHIKVAHVEAGLRSFDRRMPEEANRILADQISDFLFAPTGISLQNLKNENITQVDLIGLNGKFKQKAYDVGNTIVDATRQNLELARKNKMSILKSIGVESGKYVLLTSHRAENVDNIDFLKNLCNLIDYIKTKHDLTVVWPIHPRTVKKLAEFDMTPNAKLIDPLGYLEFLVLESSSKINVTDSGGVQEESCILGIPAITIRVSTDRPETVKVGANEIAGVTLNGMKTAFDKMQKSSKKWKIPYKENASTQIINLLIENIH